MSGLLSRLNDFYPRRRGVHSVEERSLPRRPTFWTSGSIQGFPMLPSSNNERILNGRPVSISRGVISTEDGFTAPS